MSECVAFKRFTCTAGGVNYSGGRGGVFFLDALLRVDRLSPKTCTPRQRLLNLGHSLPAGSPEPVASYEGWTP